MWGKVIFKIRFVNRIKISILELFCFRLPYSFSTGGCLALNHTIVEAINGYSNLMPGWGGEDDQIYARCVQTKAASSMECLRQIYPCSTLTSRWCLWVSFSAEILRFSVALASLFDHAFLQATYNFFMPVTCRIYRDGI